MEPFKRRSFAPIIAIAAIATLGGCYGNTGPGSNPRPGWTKWDRAIDNNGRLTRAGTEQHLLIGLYTADKDG